MANPYDPFGVLRRRRYNVPPDQGGGAQPSPTPAPTPSPQTPAPITSAPQYGMTAPTPGTWQIPDYAGLLAGLMAPLLAQFGAESVADRAARNAGFQRGAIQFGEVPDINTIASQLGLKSADLGKVFDPTVQAAALGNTQAGTSTIARLGQTHTNAIRGLMNALAARGILHSGETGFQRGQEDLRYTQGQYDARGQLLDYFLGLQNSFTTGERARQMAIAQARMAFMSQLLATVLPTMGPGSPGTPIGAPPGGAPPPPGGGIAANPFWRPGHGPVID